MKGKELTHVFKLGVPLEIDGVGVSRVEAVHQADVHPATALGRLQLDKINKHLLGTP